MMLSLCLRNEAPKSSLFPNHILRPGPLHLLASIIDRKIEVTMNECSLLKAPWTGMGETTLFFRVATTDKKTVTCYSVP